MRFRISKSGPFQRAQLKERARQPQLAAFIALTFSAMVASLVVLAGQTDVPQITRAMGTIVPTGDYPAIETLSGGIVKAVYVQDGQTVEAGDVLIELRHPDLSEEQEVLRGQLEANERELANVKAVLSVLANSEPVRPAQVRALKDQGMDSAAVVLELLAKASGYSLYQSSNKKKPFQFYAVHSAFPKSVSVAKNLVWNGAEFCMISA